MKQKLKIIAVVMALYAVLLVSNKIVFFLEQEKVISIVENEQRTLQNINDDRNFLLFPHMSNSILLLDAYFFNSFNNKQRKKNNELMKQFQLKLLKNQSLIQNSLVFDFNFPEKEILIEKNWVLLLWTNLSQVNHFEGLINLKDFSTIQFPIRVSRLNRKHDVELEIGLSILRKPQVYSNQLIEYQYTVRKKLDITQDQIQNLNIPLKDFYLSESYQPNIPLSTIPEKDNIRLNILQKGYLNNFYLRLIFHKKNTTENFKNQYLAGILEIKNPVLMNKNQSTWFHVKLHLISFISLFCILFIYLIIKSKITLETTIKKKKKKEKQFSTIENRIVEGLNNDVVLNNNGYYLWELKKSTVSKFKGIICEDFGKNNLLNSPFFLQNKNNLSAKTIIMIIDYDNVNHINHNILYYHNPDSSFENFPAIQASFDSQWFLLLTYLIQTKNGFVKIDNLDYNNIFFNGIHSQNLPCLRIPKNNKTLGINNQMFQVLMNRYHTDYIIGVERKSKERIIHYYLNREIDYILLVHSNFIQYSAFKVMDYSKVSFDKN
ncbi:MAG: hypothetical protein MJB14_05335 [Spirochaetes bacterium]|nr:hypothetical protein [Spirochaetota bacterium]